MGKMRSSKYDVTTAYGLCQDYLPPDGALCIGEDYVIMSQCAHNKAIHLAAEGTVSVTDIAQTQNITIVGLPDYVNNEFKIALYAKETQRYLCFNDNWKLVGMKELRNTCYFNETIVHGYFVFRSVVDLQRRVGFTQRGKPVGPKKSVNDACFLFTKIDADQFFHQHSRPKWRETGPIHMIPSTLATIGSVSTATSQQRGSNRKSSRIKNNYNNNNKKYNNQNQKLQQQQQQQQQQYPAYGHNSNLSSTRNQQQQQQQQQVDLSSKQQQQLQQTHNEYTRERVQEQQQQQHQVRHHHNDPTLIARRQQHEHKQKRRQRNRQRVTPSPMSNNSNSNSNSNKKQQHMLATKSAAAAASTRTTLATSTTSTTTTSLHSRHATQTPSPLTSTSIATSKHKKQHAIIATTSVIDKSTAATATHNMITSTTTVANKRKGRRRKGNKRKQHHQNTLKEQQQYKLLMSTMATFESTSNNIDDYMGSGSSSSSSSSATTYADYDIYNSSSSSSSSSSGSSSVDWTTWLATPIPTFETSYSADTYSPEPAITSDADEVASTLTTTTNEESDSGSSSSTSTSTSTQQDISDFTYENVSDQQFGNSTIDNSNSIVLFMSSTTTPTSSEMPNSINSTNVASVSMQTTIADVAWSTFINELEASNETDYTNFDSNDTNNNNDDDHNGIGNTLLPTTYDTKVNFETEPANVATTTSEENESKTSSTSSNNFWKTVSASASPTATTTRNIVASPQSSSTQTSVGGIVTTATSERDDLYESNLSNVPYQYVAGTSSSSSSSSLSPASATSPAVSTFTSPTLTTLQFYNKWHTTQQQEQYTNQYTTDEGRLASVEGISTAPTTIHADKDRNTKSNASLTDYELNTSISQYEQTPIITINHKHSRHRNVSSNNEQQQQQQQLLTRDNHNNDKYQQQSNLKTKQQLLNVNPSIINPRTKTFMADSSTTTKAITLGTTVISSTSTATPTPTQTTTTIAVNHFPHDTLSIINKNINHNHMNNTLIEATAATATATVAANTPTTTSAVYATAATTPLTTATLTTTKKSPRKTTQKLLATPYHQLTYVRNAAGDIDIDNIDNISVYPDLFGGESTLSDNDDDLHNNGSSNSRLTFVSGYLPTSATAVLPESIRIAKIKINRERERLLGSRRLFRNYA